MTEQQRAKVRNPFDAFRLLFTENMLQRVLQFTNQKREEYYRKKPTVQLQCPEIDENDIWGFIGVVLYAGRYD